MDNSLNSTRINTLLEQGHQSPVRGLCKVKSFTCESSRMPNICPVLPFSVWCVRLRKKFRLAIVPWTDIVNSRFPGSSHPNIYMCLCWDIPGKALQITSFVFSSPIRFKFRKFLPSVWPILDIQNAAYTTKGRIIEFNYRYIYRI